jgi:SHS family lactate transporter-like MFS transporter
MITALLCAVFIVPLWAYAPTVGLLVTGAFLIQFMVQGAWGIIPAHLSELSPDSVRGFLPGFAYQCGVLLAGFVAPLEAIFARHTSYSNAMAATAFVVFVLAAVVAALGREQTGIQFGI